MFALFGRLLVLIVSSTYIGPDHMKGITCELLGGHRSVSSAMMLALPRLLCCFKSWRSLAITFLKKKDVGKEEEEGIFYKKRVL